MVTKRTRWLSAISVVLMLISMLACIFPAFAQDVSSAEALLEKANKYEAKNFTDDANAIISGENLRKNEATAIHAEWAENIISSYPDWGIYGSTK